MEHFTEIVNGLSSHTPHNYNVDTYVCCIFHIDKLNAISYSSKTNMLSTTYEFWPILLWKSTCWLFQCWRNMIITIKISLWIQWIQCRKHFLRKEVVWKMHWIQAVLFFLCLQITLANSSGLSDFCKMVVIITNVTFKKHYPL